MTPEAIRDGFARLRSDAEMQPLASAARSRNEADWLVGINATRAFTLRLSGGRGSTVTSLGRVQTPTLAIIVERENKIREFKPRDLHEIIGIFRAATGEYAGRWFDEVFQKDEDETERTKRLLHRLQLTLPDAEQRLPLNAVHYGTSTAPRRDCGIMKSPRPSSASPAANRVSSNWKKRRRACNWLLNFMISLPCSAKRIIGSDSPRNARCKSRRRFTKSTRLLLIRARIRAHCPRIISRQ